MSNPTPTDFLHGKNACANGTDYAMSYQNMSDVWEACCDGGHIEWLTWILSSEPSLAPKVHRFACWCVRNTPLSDGRTVWDLLTDPRSRASVAAAERYTAGDASEAELHDACAAADAAYSSAATAGRAPAYDSAAYAAYAAAASAHDSAAYSSASAAVNHAVASASAAAYAAAYAAYVTPAHTVASASAKDAARLAQIAHLRAINPFTSTESLP